VRLTFRPIPFLHLFVWFVRQFLLSNLLVARAVLFPGRWVHREVVHVELRSTSPTLAALVSNITALTPGMQPVDGRPDGSAIDVHVLSLVSEESVRDIVQRLEELVLAAFDPASPPGSEHREESR
jgi:multicomponent Na+:H+ antiporter subunit E